MALIIWSLLANKKKPEQKKKKIFLQKSCVKLNEQLGIFFHSHNSHTSPDRQQDIFDKTHFV